jgi:hypothetical protein
MTLRAYSRWIAAGVVCLAGSLSAGSAAAQNNTMFGSSGALSGGSGFGAGTGNLGGGMGSAFPASGMSGGGGGMSGGGVGMAMPAINLPSNALPGMTGATGQMGATGQGQAGFVGMGSGFVGQTPGTQQQTGLQNRPGQNRNTGRAGRGQGQNQNQMGGAGNQQQQRTIRPQLVVAFTAPLPAPDIMSTRLQTRLQKIKKTSPYEGVQVDVEGNKVILRGEVNSAQDARMASMLARLEPGVRKVDNQLTIREPAPAVE